MDQALANGIVAALKGGGAVGIEQLEPAVVEGFHPWARGKPVLGVFRHRRGDDALHLLVIDWKNRPDHFYLVVFGNPTGAPILEAHKVEGQKLSWRYVPRSRDGRNAERQKRFNDSYGGSDVELPLPGGTDGVPTLVNVIWKVVDARRAAEDMPDAKGEVAPASTRAWIFQANPKYYDLEKALGQLQEQTWQVNQHADTITPDDAVFLWLSGKGGGLLARGTILSAPAPLPLPDEERPFVLDEKAITPAKTLRVRVHVDEMLDEPLDRETLREDPRLVGLSFLRTAQGTNFPVAPAECAALLELAAGGTPPRVVKIAPGERGKFWDDCRKGSYICVGWDEVGDLRQYTDKSTFRAAFRSHYDFNGVEGAVTKKASELWTLRELKTGDIVVANRGMSEILAVGRVLEAGYSWRPERPEYKHTVAVKWDTSVARKIPKQSYWGTVTVSDIPTELFRAIVKGTEVTSTAEPADDTTFIALCAAMQDAGLSYSQEVLSAYLLALQAKRFVILTGISGTGKTQLALTAARVLGTGTRSKEVTQIPKGAFELTVRPYMIKYNRLVLPQALVSAMRMPESIRQGQAGEIGTEWPGGKRSLSLGAPGKGNAARQLLFSGPFRSWFESQFSVGDPFYVELLEVGDDAPHRLRFGIPKKVVREVEEAPRYAVVAVRPDWTDNRGLLGYYNPILQEYVTTDFLRLLLRAEAEERDAKANDRRPEPYFVMLDEMNLARVEQYFSDFLSAVESGEPIELHNDDDVETGEKSDDVPVPKKVRVPRNLYFTGTVNVDETTYMFSSKVLDRGFVMELNLVDLEGFSATGVAGEQHNPTGLRLTGLPTPLHTERAPNAEDWEQLGTLLEGSLRRVVVDLHRLLEQQNRHFGYRVANEIARFVVLALDQCTDAVDPARMLWTALDLAVLFKVLPKLHGTQQELEDLLASLFVFATTTDYESASDPEAPYDGWMLERDTLKPTADSGHEPAYLPRTAAKLRRMADQLRRRGFTSFIE